MDGRGLSGMWADDTDSLEKIQKVNQRNLLDILKNRQPIEQTYYDSQYQWNRVSLIVKNSLKCFIYAFST